MYRALGAAKATKPPETRQARPGIERRFCNGELVLAERRRPSPAKAVQAVQAVQAGDPVYMMVFRQSDCSSISRNSFAMPAQYDKLGIRFQYPENWTLDEIEARDNRNSVSVYSPGGAFWSITLHPPDSSPQDLADAALAAMRQEYDELDAAPVAETVAGRNLVGWDMNFYCLDLTNTAIVRGFKTHEATYLVFCQADDREFDAVERIFAAITFSLLS